MRGEGQWVRGLEALGLDGGASWAEVQRRYRSLALALHPDVNRSAAAGERFGRVARAYAVLERLEKQRRAGGEGELERLSEDRVVGGLSVEELVARLCYSSSPQVRQTAAYLLGRRGGERQGREALRRAVRDGDAAVRQAARRALGGVWGRADAICGAGVRLRGWVEEWACVVSSVVGSLVAVVKGRGSRVRGGADEARG